MHASERTDSSSEGVMNLAYRCEGFSVNLNPSLGPNTLLYQGVWTVTSVKHSHCQLLTRRTICPHSSFLIRRNLRSREASCFATTGILQATLEPLDLACTPGGEWIRGGEGCVSNLAQGVKCGCALYSSISHRCPAELLLYITNSAVVLLERRTQGHEDN